MKLIHLTDTHLVAPPQTLFNIDPGARLARAIKSINTHHSDAELCLVTGDLTHWGEPAAFKLFTELMGQLACPWKAIPGNHDLRTEFMKAMPQTRTDTNGFIQFSLETSAGRFICLDTLDEGYPTGLLCAARLEGLKSYLDEAMRNHQKAYLFMHHAPFKVGIAALDKIRLMKAQDFSDALEGYTHIRHIFFGHLHRACHGSWRGIPFSTLKSTAHQSSLTLDPNTPLTSSYELPAYAVVLIDPESVVIHDHSYMEEDKSFLYDRGIPEGATAPPEHQRDWS